MCKLKVTTTDVAQALGSRLLQFVWCPILTFCGNDFFRFVHLTLLYNQSQQVAATAVLHTTQVTKAMQTWDDNDVGAWVRGVQLQAPDST